MKNPKKSLFFSNVSPVKQGIVISGLAALLMCGIGLMDWLNLMTVELSTFWILALSAILLYILFSAIFCISTDEYLKYFVLSLVTYVALCCVVLGLAWLLARRTPDEVDLYSFVWFLSVSFGIITALAGFMRFAIKLAQGKGGLSKNDSGDHNN